MFKEVLIVILGWSGVVLANNITAGTRNEKVFSLFSVVQFPNDICTSTSTSYPMGTCYAAAECSSKSGTALGNCAAGFGVCCVFTSSTCGETISNNMTYISNPSYPGIYTVTTAGSCTWTVKKATSSVCQLRLDFDTLVQSMSSSNQGCCGSTCIINSDSLTVTGDNSAMKGLPLICGTNTGYHMYVDLGADAIDTSTLEFYSDTATAISNRQWNVKVSQIECNANWRAPFGCTQYFMGLRGTVYSYNWQAGNLLGSQDYTNCVRRELGYCGLGWSENSSTSPDPFDFLDPGIAGDAVKTCTSGSYISIPGGITFTATNLASYSRHCGDALGIEVTPDPLTAYTKSFELNLVTTSSANAVSGMALDYTQQPCGFAANL